MGKIPLDNQERIIYSSDNDIIQSVEEVAAEAREKYDDLEAN